MRLFAYAESPVQYHVDIYRNLARKVDHFHAFFASKGLAEANTYAMWGTSKVHNKTGLLDGYDYSILTDMSVIGVYRRLKEVGAKRGDGLLLHTVLPKNSRNMILAAKVMGLRLIYRGSSYLGPFESRVSNLFRLGRDRLSLLPMDVFCATGTTTWRFFEKYAPGKPIVFSPYITDEFAQEKVLLSFDEIRERKREELGLRKEDCAFVYVGRFTGIKNVFSLLRAYGEIHEDDSKLFLAGDGPDRESTLQAIDEYPFSCERPKWLGFLQREEVLELLAAADVLILPSFYEPWGVVINEAIRLKTVCVVSTAVGSRLDMIVSGKNGVVIDPYRVESLKNGLLMAREIVQKGDFYAENKRISILFSAENASRGVLDAWRGINTSTRPPGMR